MASPRIYVTGRIALENGTRLAEEHHLPGRQGRLAFAFLILQRHFSANRDELVNVLWAEDPPCELDTSLSAILSKLRSVLRKVGVDARIDVRFGTVQLHLPADTWIDLEEAANSIDEAEGALRIGSLPRGWGLANVAVCIGRRSFLPDEEAPWIELQRSKLRALLVRGLECLSEISLRNGESALAIQYAAEIVEHERFRETAYQRLMRLHAGMGNRSEALRIFARCRELLREELGASPSPETDSLFQQILRAR
ncbi:MAG TPA: bacterial transcriptional activator domain-containing protein [Terriglobales bacterium]|nr:bacterial transcriptional activator domain-containing protein [Terriglobales bacterium]